MSSLLSVFTTREKSECYVPIVMHSVRKSAVHLFLIMFHFVSIDDFLQNCSMNHFVTNNTPERNVFTN
jgi:hypothetical protein